MFIIYLKKFPLGSILTVYF